jgi:hypothetical protein
MNNDENNPLHKLNKFIVTKEMVKEMTSSKFIWHDIMVIGHLSVWTGPAGSGKTALARQAAKDLASQGYEVLYFQEDAGAGDLPNLQEHAEIWNYSLLNSTLADSSAEVMLNQLQELICEKSDLSEFVLFFDTLKKFCDIMGKSGTRDFFILMRSLTAKGATVILLGHNTKRPDIKGKQIFDGVGDIRNDVDELIYIESTHKNSEGLITITMNPDKVRCLAKPISFNLNTITTTIEVLDDSIDVNFYKNQQGQYEADLPVIEMVLIELRDKKLPITTLVNQVRKRHDCRYGAKYIKSLVERYLDSNPERVQTCWYEMQERTNNARIISLSAFM